MNLRIQALSQPLLVGAVALMFCGCSTNRLQKFYVDVTRGAPVPKDSQKAPPLAFFIDDLQGEVTRMVKQQGFVIVGYADYWTSEPPTIPELQKKGRQVGASHVLCCSKYRQTITQYRPMFNYVPGTTATYNGNGTFNANGSTTANGYGWNGYGSSHANGSYSSSAYASTPGRVEYAGSAPVNTRLYDVGAVFLRESSSLASGWSER